MSSSTLAFALAILALAPPTACQTPAASLASFYSLTTSTAFPFPTATMSPDDAQDLLTSRWGLIKGRIQDGNDTLAFVDDPFPDQPAPGSSEDTSSTSAPVLRVTYPAGSFSHSTGGAQFINLWNSTNASTAQFSDLDSSDIGFGSLLLEYEVAFDADFDWVQGGKLPGLRGGLDSTGCSGGSEPGVAAGDSCFSTRLMWRTEGAGEVYAYAPETESLCEQDDIICNDDYGVSMGRGRFGFQAGRWNRIAMLVQLNSPASASNGNIELYYNGQPVVTQQNLRLRATSAVSANGLFFSTFFGGSDESWATPNTTHTYFRNMRMWGSVEASNSTGSVNRASRNGGPDVLAVMLAMGLAVAAAWVL
ncbi:polysaccharide lyase family 14 protein [Schizophyllum amplum]|uniref:Polysaccharide lyase family 14 protein n=1 Tax=Schizophyllum amplum TaxID=97359 RepID=A0A550CZ32_9AGAR|nr:polysaccharide lyase family 14 protein [Auriculariopsis ampla]